MRSGPGPLVGHLLGFEGIILEGRFELHQQREENCHRITGSELYFFGYPREVQVKRLALFSLCLVGVFFIVDGAAHGQAVMAGDEVFIEMLKHDIDQTRTEVMTSVMGFSAEEKAVFWPVYNEYRKKSDELARKDLALMKEYSSAYWSLTDDQAEDMAGRYFELEVARKKLLGELYKELAKVVSPVQALKACQLESRLDLVLDTQIANELPMIE